MESPLIRGRPEQFEEAAGVFKTIADRTDPLSNELLDLRCGRSEGFAGEAAEAIGQRIGEILVPLSDVPKVSSEIDAVFDQHTRRLEALVERANQAVARAHTRWNRKESAEADVNRYERSVSYLSGQISQLRCCCSGLCACGVPAQVASLESQRWNAQRNLSHASGDLQTAERLVEDSRSAWTHLRSEEEELNESTGHRLKTVPLWSLRDTGNYFTERAEQFVEWAKDLWDNLIVDFIEGLYHVLDTLLDFLDAVGLIVEFIPFVGQVFKVIEAAVVGLKTLSGLVLVLSGHMDFTDFALDFAIDMAGFVVPGGRFIAKGASQFMKRAGPHIKRASSRVERVAKDIGDGLDELGDAVDGGMGAAGRQIKKGSDRVADQVQRWSRRSADDLQGWTRRQADFYHEPVRSGIRVAGDVSSSGIRATGDVSSGAIRATGRVSNEVLDKTGDIVDAALDGAGDVIEYAGKTQRRIVHGTVDVLNTELPRSWDRYLDIGLDLLETPADRLESELEELKREREASRNRLPLSEYGRPIKPGHDPVLVPCHL